VVIRVLVREDGIAGSKDGPAQAGDRLPGTGNIEHVRICDDLLLRAHVDPCACTRTPSEVPEMVRLQVVMPFAELHKVGELRPSAFRDRDDVVTFQAVGDTASRDGTHSVPLAQSSLEVSGNAAAEVADRGDVDAVPDDELRPGVAEEELDCRKRDGSDPFNLTQLIGFDLTSPERLGTHMQHDLRSRTTAAGCDADVRPAQSNKCVGHVRLVRLPSAGPARFVEDGALHGLECVLHHGTFHGRELAANRDCSVLRRSDVEVAPLPETGFPKISFLLRVPGSDDTLTLEAQLVERVLLGCVDQSPRGICVRLDCRQDHRRLSWGDLTASQGIFELGLGCQLVSHLKVAASLAHALASLPGEPPRRRRRAVSVAGVELGGTPRHQKPCGCAQLFGPNDPLQNNRNDSRLESCRLELGYVALQSRQDSGEAGIRNGSIEHTFDYSVEVWWSARRTGFLLCGVIGRARGAR
jgi:hypothetical protein